MAHTQIPLLVRIWKESLSRFHPAHLLRRGIRRRLIGRIDPGASALFWGKASHAFYKTWAKTKSEHPFLVLSPEPPPSDLKGGRWIQGEHPLPGEGSFQAGEALLDFMDSLRRLGARRLQVFLSGGASSLAWVRPASLSRKDLQARLLKIYSSSQNIEEINRRRSELCLLKGGGSARWLRRLAPQVRANVNLVSDVFPFGPEVVGSGPFWESGIHHYVLADNSDFVRKYCQIAQRAGLPVLSARSGILGSWESWIRRISFQVHKAMTCREEKLLIWGGEPSISLPPFQCRGEGGRQTHLALALVIEFHPLIASGQLEILAASTDGSDGNSGASAAFLDSMRIYAVSLKDAKTALRNYNSASVLKKCGALIPQTQTGTNLQDVLVLKWSPFKTS